MDYLKSLLLPNDPLLSSLRLGAHNFPGIWGVMFPAELLQLRFPDERRATCMDCPKACYESYRADYRCCTYLPQVSNFLLGLSTETSAGDLAIDRLLKQGLLLPEGMRYTPLQWMDFLDDEQEGAFGRSDKVLCPMLDSSTGFCDIHAFRNAVCSTYFCYNDQGGAGESFWVQLQTLGSTLEATLAQWALQEIGFDLDHYFKTFDQLAQCISRVSTKTGWSKDVLALLWGEWYGREKELLRACAAIIVQHREGLWAIASQFKIRESDVFDKAMVEAVPPHLQGQVDIEGLGEDAGEILNPQQIWGSCLESYEVLWRRPKEVFILSSKISFVLNNFLTAEELYYKSKEYFIEYRYDQSSFQAVWRLALSRAQKQCLELFMAPGLLLDAEAVSAASGIALAQCEVFLSEMIHKKVLWPL